MHLQRLKELREAGAAQKADLERLQGMCAGLAQEREAFGYSLDRAQKLHGNLQRRCARCQWQGFMLL